MEGRNVDEKFKMDSKQTILNLKEKLSEKHYLTLDSIELSLIEKNKEIKQLSNENQVCFSVLKNYCPYLKLDLKINPQHYGFHSNCSINADDFLKFFRETELTESSLRRYCCPKEPEKERQFQSIFLKFCYSAIKKGFDIKNLI